MKTKINRKNYDIEAAKALAIYSNNQPVGSVFRFSEVLYIRPDSKYFLHGSGGAMTQYAKRYKNRSNASGEAIVLMTEEQAKAWTKRWFTRAVYQEIFGAVAE